MLLLVCFITFVSFQFSIVNGKMFIGHFKIITRTQYIRYLVSIYLYIYI